jgi:hypothetical protein
MAVAVVVARFPVSEIQMPVSESPYWNSKNLKVALVRDLGFVFSGEVDADGCQAATLPEGWSVRGAEPNLQIFDPRGRKRIHTEKKFPWISAPAEVHLTHIYCYRGNATKLTDGW